MKLIRNLSITGWLIAIAINIDNVILGLIITIAAWSTIVMTMRKRDIKTITIIAIAAFILAIVTNRSNTACDMATMGLITISIVNLAASKKRVSITRSAHS